MRLARSHLTFALLLALLIEPRLGRDDPRASAVRRPGPFAAGDDPSSQPTAQIVRRIPAPDVPGNVEAPQRRPFTFVSPARMLGSLSELVAIGPDALYRTSGSVGEREAFSWLASRVAQLKFLEREGATVERMSYRVPLATEVRQASLTLTLAGRDLEVPAHALQGHRDVLSLALRFDSDGQPNDQDENPVSVAASARLIRGAAALSALRPGSLRGTVALVDFALLDRGVVTATAATQAATTLLAAEPAALVLVSRFSNAPGVAHGSFLGDLSAFINLYEPAPVPTLSARLEDFANAGILDWVDLGRVSRARVVWDADVISPASSEFFALHVPGRDRSRAVLLGAHLDSANSPGAMDDGSGVVTLLEVARVLDEGRVTPPVDVWLLWFGSHERGLYGSSVFGQAHSELLDRSLAMLEVDCLTHPLDGLPGELVLEAQSFRALGDSSLPFPMALREAAAKVGVRLAVVEIAGVVSDNSSFDGLGVPNADTIYLDRSMVEVHVQGHLHDPYDDLALAALHPAELASMAKVALAAILDLPAAASSLRVTPPPVSRAVFVASHTEAVHMTPAHLALLGMQLAWEGYDVDVVPYGTPVTSADLEGAGLVFVLPVIDYPSALGGTQPYDESFSSAEIDALTRYAEDGGLLVLTASATRLRYGTTPVEENEDREKMNALGERLGAVFENRLLTGTEARTVGSHPLVSSLAALPLTAGNGLAIRAPNGQVLAEAGNDVAAALVGTGSRGGEVLALSDLGFLGGRAEDAVRQTFWRNLARYGLSRGR